jgi:integrase
MSIACRTLYETGCRIGELRQIERQDVNEETCEITIQHPEKNSNPRRLKVSSELIGLLKTLPQKYGSHLFNPKKRTYETLFSRQRKKIADKLGKPQFLQIHFHTFRHARATIDRLAGIELEEIKQNLGHKSIMNTEKYDHWSKMLAQHKNERYCYKAVTTDEDADKLIEEGWTHVCNNPSNGHMLFRKPK